MQMADKIQTAQILALRQMQNENINQINILFYKFLKGLSN